MNAPANLSSAQDGTFVRRVRAVDYKEVGEKPDFDSRQTERSGTKAGFIMLFDRSYKPIGPANQYLNAVCGNDRGVLTQNAYADDLAQWWAYLGHNDIEWDEVDLEQINAYARTLIQCVCRRTGRAYASATIERRVGTVETFYHWAFADGLIERPVIHLMPESGRGAWTLNDARIWAKRRPGRVRIPRRLPKDAHVEPFAEADLHAVLKALGPSPFAAGWPKDVSVRNRLIAQVAVLTGMRIFEVCSLTTHQISNVAYLAARATDDDLIPIRLVVTKNRDPRTAWLPRPIWKALERYIDGERAAAVEKAETAGRRCRDHAVLFVNGITANKRDRGQPVSTDTVSRAFWRAMKESGQVDTVTVRAIDPADGSLGRNGAGGRTGTVDREVTRRSFHDLRHTFAVAQFRAAVENKSPAPVKNVQSLLGHRQMSTTADIYLAKYDAAEAAAADALAAWLRKPGDAD